MDGIAEFSGATDGMTINQWLQRIDAIGDLYDWDDRARIFCMTGKLTGNAKSWYECQSEFGFTWAEWKEKLITAFPTGICIAAKLREFVTVERKQDQDLIAFYYYKLRLGQNCELSDGVITDVIVSTLGDNVVTSSAKAAGCQSTAALLNFLNKVEVTSKPLSNTQKTKFHSSITGKINKRQLTCYRCKQIGHKAAFVNKYLVILYQLK